MVKDLGAEIFSSSTPPPHTHIRPLSMHQNLYMQKPIDARLLPWRPNFCGWSYELMMISSLCKAP